MWLLSTVRKRLSEQTSRGENHEDQTLEVHSTDRQNKAQRNAEKNVLGV